jgi:hypothetical protein
MSKSNYKLPALPGLPPVPSSVAKTTPPRTASLTKTSGFNQSTGQPISFGRASRAATRNSSSPSQASKFLSGSSSSGLGGTVSQALGFGGGIGSLISGLASLFGGGKTAPPPLLAYQLPTSLSQTITIGSAVSTPGVYGGPPAASPFENHSGQIVQSVKQALLNSSSLNDVIAEL